MTMYLRPGVTFGLILILGIAVASTQSPALDPVNVAPHIFETVLENDQVRVLRITYGPNEKSVMHEHPAGVAVFLTDNQHWRFALPDGTTEDVTGKAGEASWNDAVKHLPENLADQTAEVILVELKTN